MRPKRKLYQFLAGLDKVIDVFQRNIAIIAFGVMTITILVGIVMRFLLKIPNLWGEEVSRYSMIVGVFFAVGLGVRYKEHMRIDMLLNHFPTRIARAVEFFSRIVELVAYIVFAKYSFDYIKTIASFGQKSPSLQLPMWVMYSVLLIGFVLAAVEVLLTTWNDFIAKEKFLDYEVGEDFPASS